MKGTLGGRSAQLVVRQLRLQHVPAVPQTVVVGVDFLRDHERIVGLGGAEPSNGGFQVVAPDERVAWIAPLDAVGNGTRQVLANAVDVGFIPQFRRCPSSYLLDGQARSVVRRLGGLEQIEHVLGAVGERRCEEGVVAVGSVPPRPTVMRLGSRWAGRITARTVGKPSGEIVQGPVDDWLVYRPARSWPVQVERDV